MPLLAQLAVDFHNFPQARAKFTVPTSGHRQLLSRGVQMPQQSGSNTQFSNPPCIATIRCTHWANTVIRVLRQRCVVRGAQRGVITRIAAMRLQLRVKWGVCTSGSSTGRCENVVRHFLMAAKDSDDGLQIVPIIMYRPLSQLNIGSICHAHGF